MIVSVSIVWIRVTHQHVCGGLPIVLVEVGKPAYCGWHHSLVQGPGIYVTRESCYSTVHSCIHFALLLCVDVTYPTL